MTLPNVIAVGILITIGLVLDSVAIFTKVWITNTVQFTKTINYGIVPYHSDYQVWFCIASILIYFSLGVFVLTYIAFMYTFFQVKDHGCGVYFRRHFIIISGGSSLCGLFSSIGFLIMAINCDSFQPVGDSYLNWSAYLCISSTFCCVIAGALSTHIVKHHCS